MSAWKWGPKLRANIEAHGLPWRVVDQIPPNVLGSSPGDICWTGSELLIERECPTPWVAHELAHYLVQRVEEPETCRDRNWGFDFGEFDGKHCYELIAAKVTIVILVRLRYPYKWAAWEMNMNGVSEYMTSKDWAELRRKCEQVAAPYMEGWE